MSQRPALVPTVDVVEAKLRLDGADAPLLVDVRERDEFTALRVPGAFLLPMSELNARFTELPQDRPLLVMCGVGGRSARVTEALLGAGWSDVTNVAGGITAWHARGYDTRSGPPQPGEGEMPGAAGGGTGRSAQGPESEGPTSGSG